MAVDLASRSFNVKGMLPSSMLDWDGRIVATLFMGGCNLRCPFCHNPSLALGGSELAEIAAKDIEARLRSKEGWLDGVCVTGGEPTISKQLPELLRLIRSLGLKVKLDTNGTMPDVLEGLIKQSLLDAVAMDIKTGFAKYARATGVADTSERVRESIRILTAAECGTAVEVEFRTTVVPTFVERADVLSIAQHLASANARRYFLQQFNPKEVLTPEAGTLKPYNHEFLLELAAEASRFVPTRVR